MIISDIKPIPVDFRKELYDYYIPWRISDRIFNEMERQNVQGGYNKVQILPTDPEWRFVWRYFHHDKPNKYGIKRIYCIHQVQQQEAFELNLSNMETEVNTFKPTWNQEPRASQRAKVIERWKQTADVFSPFDVMESDGKRKSFQEAKVLPLWRGSNRSVLDSIVKLGFNYFGKTSSVGEKSQNTDDDFFERGIYFTNSARYASDIYSRGTLVLTWISMREPFPVVGDPKQEYMQILNAKRAYKNYNAHYIPVTSKDPSNLFEKDYYPTQEEETPHCDEFVVFQKSQILPRFWIELEVELPYAPSDTPQFVNELISHIMKLLQNPNVDKNQKLRNYLCKELGILLTLEEDDYLEEKHETMYKQLNQIFDSQGKVNRKASRALTGTSRTVLTSPVSQSSNDVSTSQTNASHQPVASGLKSNSMPYKLEKTHSKKNHKKETHINKHRGKNDGSHKLDSLSSKPTAISKAKDSDSSIAFGKADWEKYFGDIGAEPPLPSNIEEILNESCSFWPNKKVKETHILVLIPNKVNGQPFTLDYLGELIKKPKCGHATKYRDVPFGVHCIGHNSYPSHWVLITKEMIPGAGGMCLNCSNMIASHSEKTGLSYKLPHLLDAATCILMHYFKTGERLYAGWSQHFIYGQTWTYCQDLPEGLHPFAVGGFSPDGLCFSILGYNAAVVRVLS